MDLVVRLGTWELKESKGHLDLKVSQDYQVSKETEVNQVCKEIKDLKV